MSSKKKASKKAPRKAPQGAVLTVEVLQFGAPQASGRYEPGGLLRKEISFGSSRFADMQIPFSKLPGRVPVFEIQGQRVCVVLDPRTEGFVNRGGEFGDVREFLSPRGAIAEISSIDDPLRLEIQPGSRGSLRIYGFEVIFKYEKPLPVFRRILKVKGEERGAFTPPHVDSDVERRAVWIAAAAVALAMIPFSVWLMKAPVERIGSVSELPQQVLAKVVHPSHLSLLPRVLDESPEGDPRLSFRPETSLWHAAFWVGELQRRWNAAERGQDYSSPIELLRFTPNWDFSSGRADAWRALIDRRYGDLELRRQGGERYYAFQAPYPRIQAVVAGGVQGSFRSRLLRRIEAVRRVNHAVASQILVERSFLQGHYDGILRFDQKLGPGFSSPRTPLIGPKPDLRFLAEAESYLSAHALAKSIEADPHRWSEEEPEEVADEAGYHRAREVPAVWLSREGLVTPGGSAEAGSFWAVEGSLVQNALYSIAAKPVPPPPPPQARVDARAVETLILARREELKACYEAALRRNPKTSGTVRWRWIIDERGEAQDPRVVSGDIDDRELLFCIKARLVSWKFPRPVNGPVSFEYPFQFAARAR